MKSGKENIVAPACQGLALMAQNTESLHVIATANPVKDIMNVIMSDSYSAGTRNVAAQALSELQHDKRICQTLIEENRQASALFYSEEV